MVRHRFRHDRSGAGEEQLSLHSRRISGVTRLAAVGARGRSRVGDTFFSTLLVVALPASALLAGTAVASPQGADWLVIDTAEACGSCHLGSPDPTDSAALSIEGLPERAVAGQSYTLRIVVSDPALLIAGFLLKVSETGSSGDAGSPGDTDSIRTGTLASTDATTETRGARARSTRAGALPPAPGAMSWTVVWTAPGVFLDTIRFELWANAGNDDLSPLGDRLHHRVWQVRVGD